MKVRNADDYLKDGGGPMPVRPVVLAPVPVEQGKESSLVWKLVGVMALIAAAWAWLGDGLKSRVPETQRAASPQAPAGAFPAAPVAGAEAPPAVANEEMASPTPESGTAVAVALGQQRALTQPLVVEGVSFIAGSPVYVVGAKGDAFHVVIVSQGKEHELAMSALQLQELSR